MDSPPLRRAGAVVWRGRPERPAAAEPPGGRAPGAARAAMMVVVPWGVVWDDDKWEYLCGMNYGNYSTGF